LFRVLRAGGDPGRIVFSGVGKTAEEIELALRSGIRNFNCESEGELNLIDPIAGRLGVTAQFSLRVNPDVDAVTHPYISTGLRIINSVSTSRTPRTSTGAAEIYEICGLPGSVATSDRRFWIMRPSSKRPAKYSPDRRPAAGWFRHRSHRSGRRLGIAYQAADTAPGIRDFITGVRDRIGRAGLTVMIEPGRSIVGPAGVLLTRVLYRKKTPAKEFIVVDAAMNDLIRPALYKAHHEIRPLHRTTGKSVIADIVGPVCETGDFLARDREIADVQPGSWLAVASAGAYGFVQRPITTRVLVARKCSSRAASGVIRTRETYEDLIKGERL